MKGLENNLYLTLLVISNIVAILQLIAAVKWPRLARFSFFLLFAWASWTNWFESRLRPQFYLEYGELTWSTRYKDFINGWFAEHIQTAVAIIATCQALIAIAMLLKGRIFMIGAVGAIVFLLAILPFGVGSGFPCTAIMATAVFILLGKTSNVYIWQNPGKPARASLPDRLQKLSSIK